MYEANKALARAYFDALLQGGVPDDLVTDDFAGWTTLGGAVDGRSYQQMTKMLRIWCPEHLEFTIKSLTAEDDRVVAEAESKATLFNGEPYQNTYVFVFRMRNGRISSVAEHFNAVIVKEKLTPLMQQAPR